MISATQQLWTAKNDENTFKEAKLNRNFFKENKIPEIMWSSILLPKG